MSCRCLKHLKGRFNTVTLAENSAETLILEEAEAVPQAFRNVVVSCPRTRWEEFLSYVPQGTLLRDLQEESQVSDIDRVRISDALKAGQVVPGARLVRGQHIRLR